MAGLAERERDVFLAKGRVREVVEAFVEAFVEEDIGEIIDNEEEVDALEALRPRRTMSLGPAEFGGEESLRLRK